MEIRAIKDDDTKRRFLYWLNDLVKAYKKIEESNQKWKYEISLYSMATGKGFLETNKYVGFIE